MTFYLWSKTAASDADADPTVNWREGQAPSTVNGSARGMMAALAKARDDMAGMLETAGTSTAYTLASNQVFGAFQDGLFVAFVPHTTSGAAPTLNVDSLGAKPIRGTPGVDLPAGVLVGGSPYAACYDSGAQEWLLHGYYDAAGSIPIGSSVDYWGATVPGSNWAFMHGQTVSRATYPTLFARLGTVHGAGDGSTTFALPDHCGRVSAGKDDMGGTSANRLTNQTGGVNGDTLGAVGGAETHSLTSDQNGPHGHTVTGATSGAGAHSHFLDGGGQFARLGTSGSAAGGGTANVTGVTNTSIAGNHDHTVFGNAASSGSGNGHNNVQPTIICNKILRLL